MIADLLPTDEQAAIQDSVRSVATKIFPIARLHGPAGSGAGTDLAAWPELVRLGLFGLGLPEDEGGIGYGIAEEVTVACELGRFLVSPTVLATMLAVHLVHGELRAAFCNGEQRACFANPLQQLDFTSDSAEVQLLDAQGANFALLWNDGGSAVYEITNRGRNVEGIDETVSLDRAQLPLTAPVSWLSGAAFPRRAGLLLAAYLAGIAQATLAMAVEYAKVRIQFGQPIGSFQAIKHYCAEMARRSEAALSQTLYATVVAMSQSGEDLFEMSCARYLAGEAAVENARLNVQIHGGMGFTYEGDSHIYLKRSLLISVLNSSPRHEQLRIIASAGAQNS